MTQHVAAAGEAIRVPEWHSRQTRVSTYWKLVELDVVLFAFTGDFSNL